MTISSTTLLNSFFVSGANANLVFTKYIDTSVPTTKIYVSNSSAAFGIQLYPTGSIDGISFTVNDTTITELAPLTLPPNTGSNINYATITAQINSTLYNTLPVSIKTYDVKFNLVAITSSLVTVTPVVGTTSGNTTVTQGGSTTPIAIDRNPAPNEAQDRVQDTAN